MSFYSDASLALIPSGYKNGKVYSALPTDGSGDMSFTRASNATRVASSGLIEKVRTNIVPFSEQFDNAAWTKVGLTISANAAISPDGTTTADKSIINNGVTIGSITTYCRTAALTLTTGVTYVVSVYAKEDGFDSLAVRQTTSAAMGAGPTLDVVVNMTTGVAASASFGSYLGRVAASNGYYRYSFLTNSIVSATNYLSIYAEDSVATVGDGTKGILVWGAMAEIGDVMTDYIPTTTTAVSVGPVSGLPRLDYLNSSCPRLLLEPQRTNLALFSEQFDNAAWTKENATITANSVISPDGYTNADTLADNSTSGRHRVSQTHSATSGTSYTFSVFVKKNSSGRFLLLNAATLFNARAVLSLDTLEITNLNGTGKVEDYGNGWYRFSVTGAAPATASTSIYIQMQNAATDVNYVGDGSSFYLWGAQVEAGAYATSYIPTLSTSVTRVAEGCLKTGVSSLIGQTEGTLFFDFIPDSKDNVDDFRFQVGTIATDNWIFVGNVNGKIRGYVRSTSVVFDDESTTVVVGTRYKVAISYSTTAVSFYINGTLIQEVSGSYTIPTCDRVAIQANLSTDNLLSSRVNQALLFKTRLSNSDLAAITTL
jgi:hypothetical protein